MLSEDGRDVPLIPRYFDLLLLLIEQRDRAVNRQVIFDRVWADVVVSDGALTQAIRTIRRVLDDDPRDAKFIRTVSRHGYQFVWSPVVEEVDEGPLRSTDSHDGAMPREREEAGTDPFAPLLTTLLAEDATSQPTEDERYDAAVRLHELGTDEALRRLDLRPGHEQARAILRDARWDSPASGPVPLLSAQGRVRAIADVVALRASHAVRLASHRWASASVSSALAGVVAGLTGGVALALLPDSGIGVQVAIPLAIVGGVAGALGGAGIGAGLAAAEALARSARAAALTMAGAIAGFITGWLAHHLARSILGGAFGRDVVALAGAWEGCVIGAALGAGYAVATRRLEQGGMAAPRGRARSRVAVTTGACTAVAAVGLALAGRHMVGSSLDQIAGAFAGSQIGLDPLARLLGEDSLRPITRTVVSAFEALMFGAGLSFGLTRRPHL